MNNISTCYAALSVVLLVDPDLLFFVLLKGTVYTSFELLAAT